VPRVARPWFRFYVEAMRDPKMRRLTPAQRWLWFAILAAARESCRPGYLMVSEFHGFENADLADYAGMSPKAVSDGARLLTSFGMIAYDDDIKAWHVPAWNDRQYESDSSTERAALHRRKAVATTPVATPPETEAETETETPPPSVGPPKRGVRIPDEFEVTPEMADWAKSECPRVNYRFETPAFVDHWKASSKSNAVKLDWVRAWRNWMREAQRRAEGKR
jgi:hypothetical protein